MAREISKTFEETVTGTLAELAARYADAPPKGEIVVVVGPPGEAAARRRGRGRRGAARGADPPPARQAAGEVAKRFGADRKALYARAHGS